MFKSLAIIAVCSAALLASVANAQSAEDKLFREFRAQPNDLARYQYLVTAMPQLSPTDQSFAKQLLATDESELGLYNEAVRDFPFDNRLPLKGALPKPDQWLDGQFYNYKSPLVSDADVIANPTRAVDAITRLAASRRIVLVDEAHHVAQTRELTLALLPRLRALGYNYFAPEALTENGSTLTKRGYPVAASGTEYLREPLYGDILREAIRLGYTIVSYDPVTETPDRDTAQANNLYEKVFAKDPNARLFVHAGYAHIDKAKGNLYDSQPLGMQLMKLTGFVPLSIDQTQFRGIGPIHQEDIYHQLIDGYRPREPIVLKFETSGGALWSSDPTKYDVSVILPEQDEGQRPAWLTLDGQRHRWPISTDLCAETVPCVVEADYDNEPDDAIAADRYTFLQPHTSSKLYLRPGAYRLRAWDVHGKTLTAQAIQVPGR